MPVVPVIREHVEQARLGLDTKLAALATDNAAVPYALFLAALGAELTSDLHDKVLDRLGVLVERATTGSVVWVD